MGVVVAESEVHVEVECFPLPRTWRWVTVADAGANQKNAIVDGPFGSNLKLTDYVEDGTVPVLTTKNLGGSYDDLRYISQEKFGELKRSAVYPGDILVAKIGSCGKTGIYPVHMPPAIIPANLLKVTLNDQFDTKYVFHYFNSRFFQRALKTIIKASAQPAFGVTNFRKLPLPWAPLAEQRRIVAEIEKQFSRLDEAVANLKRVKVKLKRYKGSILQSVTGGQLAVEGATGASGPKTTSWRRLTVEELASREPRSIQSGPFGSNLLHSEFRSSGKLVIGIDNVQDGAFSIGSNHRISESKFAALDKYRARPRDVLITVMATVGRVCVLPEDIEPAIITKHVYRITVDRSVAVPEYVGIALRGAREVRAQLLGSVQGQTRPGLNGTLIRRIRVPIPPLEEQHRIIAEVDRRLSIVREVEAEVETNMKRAHALRQAVLGAAFAA